MQILSIFLIVTSRKTKWPRFFGLPGSMIRQRRVFDCLYQTGRATFPIVPPHRLASGYPRNANDLPM